MNRRRTYLWFIVLFCFLLQNQSNQCSSLRVKGFALSKFRERIQRDLSGALSNRNDNVHDPSFLGKVRDFIVIDNVFKKRAYNGRAYINMLARRHLQRKNEARHQNSVKGNNNPRRVNYDVIQKRAYHGRADISMLVGAPKRCLETDTGHCSPPPPTQEKNPCKPGAMDKRDPKPKGSVKLEQASCETSPPSPTSPSPTPPLHLPPPPHPSHPSQKTKNVIEGVAIAVGSFILLSVFGYIFYRSKSKKTTVKPAAVGLSGQLKKAISMGVSMLERSELQRCCEDFCNIVGVSSEFTVYKGTLSTGVEMAVASSTVKDESTWSDFMESNFTEKIVTLGRVKHKNFLALLGYCAEDQPFTRMTVLEYASNGTLFNLLHDDDRDQIEWPTRMRIVMGIAYCLEHLHQMNPPIIYRDLRTDNIYLTDDYAAKIVDFGFGSESICEVRNPEVLQIELKKNVCDFGEIIIEIMSGKDRNSLENRSLANWARNHLSDPKFQKSMLDSTISSYKEDQVTKLCEIIQTCIDPDVSKRPAMRDIVARLAGVLHISPEEATPKLSPLWWAEVEVLSS